MRRRTPIVLALAVLLPLAGGSVAGGRGLAAGPPGGEPPGLAKAKAAKAEHQDRILDTPGVAGIGVGVNKAGEAVVEVYKERADADVPATLDGVEVDSVITGIIEARSAPTDRFPRPVPIGVSAGLHDFGSGTLGARVTDGTNVFALSNNHVFAGINSASIGEAITQPGSADGGTDPADRIGTLYAYQTINFSAGSTNTIDAAIALVSTANVGTATPDDGYGTPSTVTAQAYAGLAVQKYGRTTGFEQGTVAATDVSVDVCYLLLFNSCLQQARFVNQISISPGTFSAAGDSGSLIVTQNGNQPVALLFAGGDGLTIGNPIDTVLQRFGVTIEGAPPGNGPPGAPSSLSAGAGDAQVALAWHAPAFDGGSQIANYKVYRGNSSGGETFLADAGTGTTYADTSAANGTTYYYRVTAENGNGEGAASNEASATPAPLVPPAQPLPTLDGFDRANETLSDQGRWSNGIAGSGETGLSVSSNQLACTKTTTCTAWRANAQFGPDTEVWARVATLQTGNQLRLYARVQQPGSAAVDGYMLRTVQQSGADDVLVERLDNGVSTRLLTQSQDLAAGDVLLLRVQGSTVEAWRNDGTFWARLGTTTDATYGAAGAVGVGIRGTTGRLDDFGARTVGAPPGDTTPPGAPGALQASASGPDTIDLSWQPATDDVGVARYRVERCQGSGCSSFTEIATSTQTSYSDSGLTPATSYSYRVRAEDAANNQGDYSATASATTPPPPDMPTEPLPVVDSFDRANETLSDQGRWSNGVVGSVETGLRVTSNQLSCNRSTTCSAWRNPAPYGPDTEVWARISTLPGTNNQIRLYARLQQAGTSGYDGYMLRTNQLSGADQLFLERVDNGTITHLLTINQDLAAGDTILLRVKGNTLQAWRKTGTTWTQLATTDDTTYPNQGTVGIAIRGTTGRLDDFGAR
jgi:fibronectin type III domain protein